MTIIVGIKTTVGENVVIGADKCSRFGSDNVVEMIECLMERGYSLLSAVDSLRNNKVMLSSKRKIILAKDGLSVVAFTGHDNGHRKKVLALLLSPDEFAQDRTFIREMLSPFNDSTEGDVDSYLRRFDLRKRVLSGDIPEVRRISDMYMARPGSHFVNNYHPELSECVWGVRFGSGPQLFNITETGLAYTGNYCVIGSGSPYALEYLTQQGLANNTPVGVITQQITVEDAVAIVSGAVEYANRKCIYCRGFEYVVLSGQGIEPHWSEEEWSFKVPLRDLVQKELARLRQQQDLLGRVNDIMATG
ncbi:MAG: hypothetical protein ABIG95_00290 [Candidatus Woesearchaeota archaeon]